MNGVIEPHPAAAQKPPGSETAAGRYPKQRAIRATASTTFAREL
jgi:hypothetical protein